uniref:Uncharacterized protein n=1 Tax=Anguilla anguilla TaxID=7936 RepID=A0A0E9TR43_ANGAN
MASKAGIYKVKESELIDQRHSHNTGCVKSNSFGTLL